MKEGVRVNIGRSSLLVDAAGMEPEVGSGAFIRNCCSSLGVCAPSFVEALAAVARISASSALVGMSCSFWKTETSMACIVRSAERRSISTEHVTGQVRVGVGC